MRVSSCCGCCSVKVGVLIIGSLTVICSFITIITWAIKSVEYVAMFVTPVVHLVCGVQLFFGVQNRKPSYIFPVLCLFHTDLVMTLPLISVITMEIAVAAHAPAWYYVIVILILGFCFGLATYFFIVIDTFYKELMREKYFASNTNQKIDVGFTNSPNSEPA